MELAKDAAVLRPIGRPSGDPNAAALERKLFDAARELGLGPMGSSGRSAVMAVNVETAVTHTAALPVAVNAQCLVGRRWRAVVSADGQVSYTGELA
jgi:tartrate dehydratase alpha subunit/fumarate hydratase class I-like protein